MGCFSWTYCDRSTKTANITDGAPYKLLIPKEFGGGYIKDHYRGYGIIAGEKTPDVCTGEWDKKIRTYDMYELIAFWNWKAPYKDGIVKDYLRWEGEFTPMKEKDAYTNKNREIGIDIGCYDEEIDKLKYPLKLATSRYKGTYESPELTPSYGDDEQGWVKVTWEHYDENKRRYEERPYGRVE